MSTTQYLSANVSCIVDANSIYYNDHSSASSYRGLELGKYMLFKFPTMATALSTYKNRAIRSVILQIYGYAYVYDTVENISQTPEFWAYAGTITDESTYDSINQYLSKAYILKSKFYINNTVDSWNANDNDLSRFIVRDDIFYKIDLPAYGTDTPSRDVTFTYRGRMYTSHSSYAPRLCFIFEDDNVVGTTTASSPLSGTILKFNDNIFTWNITYDGKAIELPTATSIFKWRETGSSTVNTVNCGTATSCTIPANTFTADSIDWCVETTFSTGTTSTTSWITLSTVEPTPSVTIESPKNALVDGAVDQIFSWNYNIATGSAQAKYDMQFSDDNSEWTDIRTGITSANPYATILASELDAGDLYWRVRAYNTDSVASAWSDVAHVIVVDAPDKPSLFVTSAEPKFGIRWTATGQQGYQIMLDDKLILSTYGAENAYTYDDWAEAGNHTVAVRVSNVYGIWSEWATTQLPIVNGGGPTISLVAYGAPATLQWTTTIASGQTEYDGYVIYRNGERIATTTAKAYIDHYANGNTTYTVKGIYTANGDYGSAEATIAIEYPTIALYLESADTTITLEKSSGQTRNTTATHSHDVTYLHYYGDTAPHAEVGEATEKYYTLECAFTWAETESMALLENALGAPVYLADTHGVGIYGILDALSAVSNEFYKAYSMTIREVVR